MTSLAWLFSSTLSFNSKSLHLTYMVLTSKKNRTNRRVARGKKMRQLKVVSQLVPLKRLKIQTTKREALLKTPRTIKRVKNESQAQIEYSQFWPETWKWKASNVKMECQYHSRKFNYEKGADRGGTIWYDRNWWLGAGWTQRPYIYCDQQVSSHDER